MRLKRGVKATGTDQGIVLGLMVANGVYATFGYGMVITSLNDSEHSENSLHYAGAAADLRIRHLKPEDKQPIRDEIAARLSEDYDVILEKDHIHLEYQPRR